MTRIESHRDLVVWQKAMDLAVEIYRLTKTFPKDETYRMVSQMTRAAASVPANIAEGHSRRTSRDYAQFLTIAKGSLMELETFNARDSSGISKGARSSSSDGPCDPNQ